MASWRGMMIASLAVENNEHSVHASPRHLLP
jgi:hypothetical protein